MSLSFLASGNIEVYNERLAIVLGFITLFFVLATFASCRSFITLLNHFGWKNPIDSEAYRIFYRYHFYYWWAFCFVFTLHLMTAVMHTGLSTTDDPDAYLQWYVLWSGLALFVSSLVLFSSCRSLPNLLNLFAGENPLTVKGYQLFYRYHSYYWLVFFLLIAGHFAFGYVHAGIWPR